MNTFNHTPGPWIADGLLITNKPNNNADKSLVVAKGPEVGDIHQWGANSRLIAAAPDLLEALADAMVYFDSGEEGMRADRYEAMIKKCKCALAKATG